jgi:hypothetical protein
MCHLILFSGRTAGWRTSPVYVVGLEVSINVIHHVEMLQGYENLTSVKLDFVLFEARVGDALEKLVELGAGAVPDEASVK